MKTIERIFDPWEHKVREQARAKRDLARCPFPPRSGESQQNLESRWRTWDYVDPEDQTKDRLIEWDNTRQYPDYQGPSFKSQYRPDSAPYDDTTPRPPLPDMQSD